MGFQIKLGRARPQIVSVQRGNGLAFPVSKKFIMMVTDQPAFQLCILAKGLDWKVMCIVMCISYPSNLPVLPYYCQWSRAHAPVRTFPVGARSVEYVAESNKLFSLGELTYRI